MQLEEQTIYHINCLFSMFTEHRNGIKHYSSNGTQQQPQVPFKSNFMRQKMGVSVEDPKTSDNIVKPLASSLPIQGMSLIIVKVTIIEL